MQNHNPPRPDIEKLKILLSYWVSHNNDHIRDHLKWLKNAQEKGLVQVTGELATAIEYLRKANRHMQKARSRLEADDTAGSPKIPAGATVPKAGEERPPFEGDAAVKLKQIGIIRTPYTDNAPYQPVADDEGDFRIVVNSQYSEGLRHLGRFRYIYVLYFIHRAPKKIALTVSPGWAPGIEVGVFASRSPVRPNQLGLSIVRIRHIAGNQIVTSGLDVFDGTPLLDIKPYIRELDSKSDANYGWLEDLEDRDHLMLHIRGIPHAY